MSLTVSAGGAGFPLETGEHVAIFCGYENAGPSQFNPDCDVFQLNWKSGDVTAYVSYSVNRKTGLSQGSKLFKRLSEMAGEELEVGQTVDPDDWIGNKYTIQVGPNPDSKSETPSNTILEIKPLK